METLNWGRFKAQLQQNPDLELQFQYDAGKLVDASYHITEIKQAPVTSVDCGGVMNKWTEVIVQLWEPGNQQQHQAMKASKALSIIGVVEKLLPLDPNAIVKIEFGNSRFDTRQMFPNEMITNSKNLLVNLRPDVTQCKAMNRGGSCGPAATGEECCTPPKAEKPKIKLVNLATSASCCAPGSDCC